MKRKPVIAALALAVVIALAAIPGLAALDDAYPPPLPDASTQSVEVVDRNGDLLRAFAARDGRWRLPVRLDKVDPEFVRMLVAYEDRRFWSHGGVDPLAMIRAAWQMLRHGRIVSGGSTITMQLARLIWNRGQNDPCRRNCARWPGRCRSSAGWTSARSSNSILPMRLMAATSRA